MPPERAPWDMAEAVQGLAEVGAFLLKMALSLSPPRAYALVFLG